MNAPARPYYTVLGVDPGKTNAAYSVVRFKLNPFRYKILAHGMLKKPLNDLTGLEVVTRMNAFKSEIRKLKKTYAIDFVIAERFMTRGGQSMGTTIEVVSAMLILLAHVGIKKFQFITAAQWKNQWNRHNDLKAFYKSMHPMPPHPIDATGIALYGASQLFPEDIPCFKALENIKEFTRQLIKANKEPVHEPKRNNRSKNKDSAAPKRAARSRKGRASQAKDKPVRGRGRKAVATSGATTTKATRGSRRARATTRRAPSTGRRTRAGN